MSMGGSGVATNGAGGLDLAVGIAIAAATDEGYRKRLETLREQAASVKASIAELKLKGEAKKVFEAAAETRNEAQKALAQAQLDAKEIRLKAGKTAETRLAKAEEEARAMVAKAQMVTEEAKAFMATAANELDLARKEAARVTRDAKAKQKKAEELLAQAHETFAKSEALKAQIDQEVAEKRRALDDLHVALGKLKG